MRYTIQSICCVQTLEFTPFFLFLTLLWSGTCSDKVVSTALIRIFGRQLAELPLLATSIAHQGQVSQMCPIFLKWRNSYVSSEDCFNSMVNYVHRFSQDFLICRTGH